MRKFLFLIGYVKIGKIAIKDDKWIRLFSDMRDQASH